MFRTTSHYIYIYMPSGDLRKWQWKSSHLVFFVMCVMCKCINQSQWPMVTISQAIFVAQKRWQMAKNSAIPWSIFATLGAKHVWLVGLIYHDISIYIPIIPEKYQSDEIIIPVFVFACTFSQTGTLWCFRKLGSLCFIDGLFRRGSGKYHNKKPVQEVQRFHIGSAKIEAYFRTFKIQEGFTRFHPNTLW